jgi:predicted dehydrogenase
LPPENLQEAFEFSEQSGALGKIVCGEAYYLTGYLDRPARPNASPAEQRIRNWVYDRALSGDIIVEQNIHVIDICNWILEAHPLKASASGGRQGRPPNDGDVYGNYNVLFHYPEGVDVTFSSTQFARVGGTSLSASLVPRVLLSRPTPDRLASGETNHGRRPAPARRKHPSPTLSPPRESSATISSSPIRKRRRLLSKASLAVTFIIRQIRAPNLRFPA